MTLAAEQGPLEKFKNPYQQTNNADPILVLDNATGSIAENSDCSARSVSSGANDDGTAISGSYPANTRGVLVVARLSGDNLSSTDNEIQIGYCDGEQRFKSVNDNVTF